MHPTTPAASPQSSAAQRAAIDCAVAVAPGHDHLVADVIEDFTVIIHDGEGQEAKGTVEQTVNGDAAEPLGEPGRSRDVDKQHETVFLDRGMISPGDEIQERARPDDVGDPEHQVHQNRDHGGRDDPGPEILTGGLEG
jgi:hypothetical protein